MPRAQLTIHADNGSPMVAKTVAVLLADLGVTKSHSRPHVSNDNPYSEAQFKTLKYQPDYPDRFGSVADARSWGRSFFRWYNEEHHHTGLGLLTPATVHTGRAQSVRQQRQVILAQAFQAHPERFVNGLPQPARLPEAVWINPPQSDATAAALAAESADGQAPDAKPVVSPGLVTAVAQSTDLRYAAASRTEDRATLRSNSSAVPADETDGQSCSQGALSTPRQPPSVSSLKAINRNLCGGELQSKQASSPPPTGDRQHINPVH